MSPLAPVMVGELGMVTFSQGTPLLVPNETIGQTDVGCSLTRMHPWPLSYTGRPRAPVVCSNCGKTAASKRQCAARIRELGLLTFAFRRNINRFPYGPGNVRNGFGRSSPGEIPTPKTP